MPGNRKTISFTVDEQQYREIYQYAHIKGHGGQTPASTFSHYAVFQQMKKYPLSEAEIRKYTEQIRLLGRGREGCTA